MGLFRRRRRTDAGAAISDRDANRADLQSLRDFAQTRAGVEGFLEPATTVTAATLLLVAADGEWTRRRIASPRQARELSTSLRMPLYDATAVGYPQRMRDYNAKKKSAVAPPPRHDASLSSAAYSALTVLEGIAGAEPLGRNPTREQLGHVLRAARVKAHPDRLGGDRTQWDRVEAAARTLGLID